MFGNETAQAESWMLEDEMRNWLWCVVLVAGCGSAPNPEICGDSIDNDGNGRVDDVCSCTPGSMVACLTGREGACAAGATTCDPSGIGFGSCVPVGESCR